jgi:cephalosporin hydroxylase
MIGEKSMKLTDIHTQFKTDKGTAHSYIGWYEDTFSERRAEKLNVLEIGVLFGGSLKMWEKYFENSQIYGIEDFSQEDGQWHYQYEPVDGDAVMEERITLFNFNCEDPNLISSHLHDLSFDIILDDANHQLSQQMKNFENYYPYISDGGIYICEDVQTKEDAEDLKSFILNLYPTKEVYIVELDLRKKSDDRLVVVV